jgi:hypothetical protein
MKTSDRRYTDLQDRQPDGNTNSRSEALMVNAQADAQVKTWFCLMIVWGAEAIGLNRRVFLCQMPEISTGHHQQASRLKSLVPCR